METTLNTALNLGYRHIDTAILYENEDTIGKVINKWVNDGKLKREDLFVTTKLPPMGMYQEKVESYIKASLKNLQLDYVDLYLIHSPEGIKSIPAKKEQVEMDTTVDHSAVWKVCRMKCFTFACNNCFEEIGRTSGSRARKIHWAIEF